MMDRTYCAKYAFGGILNRKMNVICPKGEQIVMKGRMFGNNGRILTEKGEFEVRDRDLFLGEAKVVSVFSGNSFFGNPTFKMVDHRNQRVFYLKQRGWWSAVIEIIEDEITVAELQMKLIKGTCECNASPKVPEEIVLVACWIVFLKATYVA